MKRAYPATIQSVEDVGYILQFRDLEEAFTEGETLDELLEMATDVLEAVLESRLELGLPLPTPTIPQDGDVLVHAQVRVLALAAT
jgi:antitoxin HicB